MDAASTTPTFSTIIADSDPEDLVPVNLPNVPIFFCLDHVDDFADCRDALTDRNGWTAAVSTPWALTDRRGPAAIEDLRHAAPEFQHEENPAALVWRSFSPKTDCVYITGRALASILDTDCLRVLIGVPICPPPSANQVVARTIPGNCFTPKTRIGMSAASLARMMRVQHLKKQFEVIWLHSCAAEYLIDMTPPASSGTVDTEPSACWAWKRNIKVWATWDGALWTLYTAPSVRTQYRKQIDVICQLCHRLHDVKLLSYQRKRFVIKGVVAERMDGYCDTQADDWNVEKSSAITEDQVAS